MRELMMGRFKSLFLFLFFFRFYENFHPLIDVFSQFQDSCSNLRRRAESVTDRER